MLLSNIISEVALKTGLTDRDRLLSYINSSMDEMMDGAELDGLYAEIAVEVSDPIVTLPHYVHRVRGLKICREVHETVRHSMVPAYNDGPYVVDGYTVRELGSRVLHTAIQDTSRLTLEFNSGVSKDVEVVLVGRTDNANCASETLCFSTKNTRLETKNKYVEITDIRKSTKTASNLYITDVLGTELCMVPNDYLTVRHIVLQVFDQELSVVPNLKIRVLYLPVIAPLINDTDSFPDLYWRVLVNRTIMNIFLDIPDKTNVASAYSVKADNELKRISRSLAEGQERKYKKPSKVYNDFIYRI